MVTYGNKFLCHLVSCEELSRSHIPHLLFIYTKSIRMFSCFIWNATKKQDESNGCEFFFYLKRIIGEQQLSLGCKYILKFQIIKTLGKDHISLLRSASKSSLSCVCNVKYKNTDFILFCVRMNCVIFQGWRLLCNIQKSHFQEIIKIKIKHQYSLISVFFNAVQLFWCTFWVSSIQVISC